MADYNILDDEVNILTNYFSCWCVRPNHLHFQTLALKKGDVLPDFCLPDGNGNLVSSVDLRAKGPLVVVFFRGNWCAFCNATLRMIRKYTPHFKARNATVVAISPLSIEETAKTIKENGLNFPVLSDTNSEYSQLLNIAFVVDDALREVHPNLSKYNDDDSFILPIPATYVIETDGRVTYSFIETDFTQRAEPVDILNALPPLRRSSRRYLKGKLDIELAKVRDTFNESTMEKFFDQIEDLTTTGIAENSIQIGDIAPDFELPNGNNGTNDNQEKISSKKLRKEGKYVVVLFYHGEWSRFCGITLEAMQRFLPKFEAKGAQVVAISPQSLDYSSRTAKTRNLTFPVLSDSRNYIADKFRLTFEPTSGMLLSSNHQDNKKVNLRAYNNNGESGKATSMLPLPAAYVIDPSGRVVYSHVQCDFTKRAEPADILSAIPTTKKVTYQKKRGPFSLRLGRWLQPAAKRSRQ